ncbi:hypothetical protein ANN_24850 [Periplaneta americana]|uniref:Uncharacterized protein n=1 Tax=Periplaneta americana TaxID=6978 RepID=A0ABQ8RZW1_PERAM|nr:hypothetical protein ANN_24850 [Periplaneta americana]
MALGRTRGKNATYQMGTHGDTVGSKNWLEKPWTTENQMRDEFKLQVGGLWTRIGRQRTRRSRPGWQVGIALAFYAQGCGFDPGPGRWHLSVLKCDRLMSVDLLACKRTPAGQNSGTSGDADITSAVASVDQHFLSAIIFTDEAEFIRNGVQNFHNIHVCADRNPEVVLETDTNNSSALSPHLWSNGQRVWPRNQVAREEAPLNLIQRTWFMHDGAPPHFAFTTRAILNQRLPNKWIGRERPTSWPSRSPDHNSLNSYLWSHLKAIVYCRSIRNLEILRQRLEEICPHRSLIERAGECDVYVCVYPKPTHFTCVIGVPHAADKWQNCDPFSSCTLLRRVTLYMMCTVSVWRIMSCTRVSVCVSVVSGMSDDDDDDEDEERRRGNPVPAHSLLLSNSTKRVARLNVLIRRTNHYQQ